ncbi:hypothetical protein PVK06_045264 [Gossypium arboreum]|uniref:RNase H type-1 domain-containing protein n=1 Tax=Gossypium arboreum TaxID=29729 RepID=A0ABR0MTK6_GOSAR|nr:hypothetical protein PVK06_045264 [Gossypium arboreum]
MAKLDGLEEKPLTLSVGRGHRQPKGNMRMTIYFDADFSRRSSKSTSGLVVRGVMGEILASKTVIHSAISFLFVAEAQACLQAIQLGILIRFNSLAIVGDSRTVIKKCQTTDPDKSIIGALIRDIQRKKFHFQEIDFQFIHRSENECAHNNAHEALKRGEGKYLVGAIPDYIRRALKNDGRGTQIEVVS